MSLSIATAFTAYALVCPLSVNIMCIPSGSNEVKIHQNINAYLFQLSALKLRHLRSSSPFFLTFTTSKCLSSILLSFQSPWIHFLRVSLISFFFFFALYATMMDCPDCRSKNWQNGGGEEAGKTVIWWLMSSFTDLSTQDNKSSECIFNTESMYTVAWRLTCVFFFFFWDLLFKCCLPDVAAVHSQHLFMVHWWSVSYSKKQVFL